MSEFTEADRERVEELLAIRPNRITDAVARLLSSHDSLRAGLDEALEGKRKLREQLREAGKSAEAERDSLQARLTPSEGKGRVYEISICPECGSDDLNTEAWKCECGAPLSRITETTRVVPEAERDSLQAEVEQHREFVRRLRSAEWDDGESGFALDKILADAERAMPGVFNPEGTEHAGT